EQRQALRQLRQAGRRRRGRRRREGERVHRRVRDERPFRRPARLPRRPELGTLSESPGQPLVIEGLWGLAFGNGKTAGDANALYYDAGPDHEAHGLFGKITANAAGTNPVTAALIGNDLVITGSRNDDDISVGLDRSGQHVIVQAGGEQIGSFATGAV